MVSKGEPITIDWAVEVWGDKTRGVINHLIYSDTELGICCKVGGPCIMTKHGIFKENSKVAALPGGKDCVNSEGMPKDPARIGGIIIFPLLCDKEERGVGSGV